MVSQMNSTKQIYGKKDIIHQNLFQKTEAMETLSSNSKIRKKKKIQERETTDQ